MNTKEQIQFIQSSRGLRLDGKYYFKALFCLPVMLLIVFFSGNWMGNVVRAVSLFVIMLLLSMNICFSFCLGRKKLLKYNLLIRPAACMNVVFPLFYACCTVFFNIFGLNRLLLYYILPVVVITLLVVLIVKRKIRSKLKSTSIISGGIYGATAFVIGRRLNSLMSEKLSDMTHFIVIAVSMMIESCITFSIAVLDLWRYYYFTKLEKAGLVTEDILKH